MTDDSALSPALAAALQAALAFPASRVMPLRVDGQRYWLKRPARHGGLLRRWRQGDPMRALAAERAGLALMTERGLPAPRVVAEGPEFLLVEDPGPPLLTLLRDPDTSDDDRLAALAEGARALAALHRAGIAHGRPEIRNICWQKGRGAALVEFDRLDPTASPRARARDARQFLLSVLRLRRQRDEAYDAAADAYRAAAPPEVWEMMRKSARRGRLCLPLARLALRLRPKAHDLRAALHLREALRD